jgi:uncharacterized cupin superfamily protein
MTRPIINIDSLEYMNWGNGKEYAARLGFMGPKIGAQKLGYNVTIVPPGKRAFPMHNHHANEEMFFVLEGVGELRIGKERYAIRKGDVIACPPGGPEAAHQIVNTSPTDELKYLSVSTMQSPEVVDYPNSGKLGVRVDLPPDADGKPRVFRFITKTGVSTDYWDGE